MKIKFLLDEDLATSIPAAVKRLDSNVDIIHVGEEGAPPLGTSDPHLLLYCEEHSRMLVTENRRTMPVHERDHFAAGRHHWGILEVRRRTSIGKLAQELHMFWAASEAEEWVDQRVYIPY